MCSYLNTIHIQKQPHKIKSHFTIINKTLGKQRKYFSKQKDYFITRHDVIGGKNKKPTIIIAI